MRNRRIPLRKQQTSETRNLASIIGLGIQNAGLWKGTNGRHTHLWAHIATFCFLGNLVLQVIALFMASDLEKLFECLSVLSFCGMGALKLYSMRRNYRLWRSLLSQVESMEHEQINIVKEPSEYESDNENNDNQFIPYLRKYTEKFQAISTLLPRVYNATLIIFILTPFLEYGFWKLRGYKTEYPHILPVLAPLDQLSFFGYLGAVLSEMTAAVYCVLVHIAFDLTAEGIMIFVCGQFSLVRDYSAGIGGRGKDCKPSKKRDDRAHHRIKKCHRMHNSLVNSIRELDKLVKNIFGVYFLVATLTLCLVAVRLVSEQLSIMQLVNLMQFMGATLTQLFLFCHYGDAVLYESSVGMGEGPYGAASWCLGVRVRRQLSLLAVGMSRPRRLRAGFFHSLDLPSFIQIVRTAYSYYAVVRK